MNNERSFENLFDDFLNDEFDFDASGIKMNEQPVHMLLSEMVAYTSQGVTYYVPAPSKSQYYFRRLTLMTDERKLSSEGEQKSLVFRKENMEKGELVMRLEDLFNKYEGLSITDDVSVLLYRVGKPEPLKVYTKHLSGPVDALVADFSEIKGGWIPGEYFFLVTNAACSEDEVLSKWTTMHSHMRYSIRVVSSGQSLEHPAIKRVSLSADKYLEVHLAGNTGNLDEFQFLMYNDDWATMAQTHVLSPYRNRLKDLLFFSSPFLDGTYRIVMLHNEEPCALITVDWKENKLAGCSWEAMDRFSPYYILAKYMLQDSDWNRLCNIPGCRSIRKAVVERYGYKIFNQWRNEHNLCCVMKPVHMSVATMDGRYDSGLVRALTALLNPSMEYEGENCERLVETKNVVDPYEDMREVLSGCSKTVLCLHHLSALFTGTNGKLFLHMLEETLLDTPDMALMLMGTQAEINQVLENSPLIARLILPENRFRTDSFSVFEQVNFLEGYLLDKELMLTSDATDKLVELILSNKEIFTAWGKEELKLWMMEEIYPRFIARLLKSGEEGCEKKSLHRIEPEDICLPTRSAPKDEFEESLRELNEMIGLDNLKQSMKTLFNRSRFDKMRREAGLQVPEKGGYHMIFTGNPGTGKTTVAKLVGQVYHSLGLLSKGGVIVTERTKLVGRYLGETEKNMAAVLEQAKGNVLFIDEAYSLCDNDSGDRRDFGCRVLESLLTVLAQKNPDMIVILAGYEKEMNQMLEMNPGMKGRFPYKFKFEDYNADELFQIANALLAKSEYILTPSAECRLKETIKEALLYKDAFFHNARWVEQYILDGVVSAMSDRLMSSPHLLSREFLQTVEVQDIETAYQKMKPQPKVVTAPRKRIGFVA